MARPQGVAGGAPCGRAGGAGRPDVAGARCAANALLTQRCVPGLFSFMCPFRPDPFIRIRISEPGGEERRTQRQQPHPPSVVEAVRQLVEGTRLPFKVIGHRTAVNGGTISRWAEKYAWQRPAGAWSSHRRPERRWAKPLIGRVLASRLRGQAERLLRDLEAAPAVDPAKLDEALTLVARAREEWQNRAPRRGEPPPPATDPVAPPGRRKSQHDRVAAALKGWRTRWSRKEAAHRWMLERE
jgi:hypothetical protein